VNKLGVRELRARAIGHSFFRPTNLKAAIERLGFVQADPIRAPARAQDLILRHRVKGYRAGDLERLYPSLDIEEDYLYVYGFLPRRTWELLHPRATRTLSALETKILAVVREGGDVHPRDLEAHFGRERVVNAWGGYSKATTRALERLHHLGLARIVRREAGVRIYEAAPPPPAARTPERRLERIVLVFANLLAPVSQKTLQAIAAKFRRSLAPREHRSALRAMLDSGELESGVVDGILYVWPAATTYGEPLRRVRLLAPFDPVVWDRARFEHLWKWSYRFEGYTPVAKRIHGYYALPLLWHDKMIGWANARVVEGVLDVQLGYVEREPTSRAFQRELEAEIARLEAFIVPRRP
jgi:uncharacterized protein YcaQ